MIVDSYRGDFLLEAYAKDQAYYFRRTEQKLVENYKDKFNRGHLAKIILENEFHKTKSYRFDF